MQQISVEQTNARLQATNSSLILLDCREPIELQTAAITGAQHIPMSEISARFHELSRESEIIVFCHHGIRSQQVAAYLEKQGFRVKNMVGGIDAWSCEIDPEVPRY